MSKAQLSEVKRIEKAIDRIEKDKPSLKPIADAFRELLIARAMIKAKLSNHQGLPASPPDPREHSEGAPLLTQEKIAALMDPWGETVELMIAPLAKAFPKIEPELLRLKESLDRGDIDLGHCIGALVKGHDDQINETASRIGLQPLVLKFLLGQILKPFVEKRTESLRPLIGKLPWHKGYCPLCGSLPELSFLQGEGQRWLRCSLCGHEWQFDRMACPYCENDNSKKKELVFVEGRQHEGAELCPKCRRYIVSIDLREGKRGLTTEVAAIGMVHLDLMAQEKGFSPVAVCAWNVFAPEDLS